MSAILFGKEKNNIITGIIDVALDDAKVVRAFHFLLYLIVALDDAKVELERFIYYSI